MIDYYTTKYEKTIDFIEQFVFDDSIYVGKSNDYFSCRFDIPDQMGYMFE